MSHLTFLETLKREVAKMQIAHPESEGELARAHALILHGMVVPSPDDPTTGQVLSSDAQTVYHVNGTCSCRAGACGTMCKHIQAWQLYKFIAGKVAAAPQSEVLGKCENLPEARASVNVRVQVAGREVQWTLRDHDESRLATRLESLLARYPLSQSAPASQPPVAAASPGEGWCSKHGLQMKQTTKNGQSWWSHRTDDGWCKGRG
jgi:hypothetical protein